jgi:hypothetical protein
MGEGTFFGAFGEVVCVEEGCVVLSGYGEGTVWLDLNICGYLRLVIKIA